MRETALRMLVVGIGGFFGAIARYGMGLWVAERWGRTFPWGTMAVNVSGCFFLGLVISLSMEKFMLSPAWRLFMAVGFLGAYTTFSTFEYETGALLRDGERMAAFANVALSVIAGFGALKLGEALARVI